MIHIVFDGQLPYYSLAGRAASQVSANHPCSCFKLPIAWCVLEMEACSAPRCSSLIATELVSDNFNASSKNRSVTSS
ncbi:unnamed protein product [Cylindrotheca closterium]|uniref:Beta-lactamase n=1 Tax=Cylindrotheca closterium TaxID=2856 RepID=A0AAD2FY73_9STRA|nr:unnamed protein product [Cylindrotheca closterium]